jgi:chlorinating enzyme
MEPIRTSKILSQYFERFMDMSTKERLQFVSRVINELEKSHSLDGTLMLEDHDLRPALDRYDGYIIRHGDGYLSEAQIKDFFTDGYMQPFKVMEREDALAFNELVRARVMEGEVVYGVFSDLGHEAWVEKAKQHKVRIDMQSRGIDRHKNIPELLELFRSPAITRRLASILGEKVYLWRTQFFPQPAGNVGTGLHQASDFSAALDGDKVPLKPKPGASIPKCLYNLNAWVALNDVTVETGALCMVRGSHTSYWLESLVKQGSLYYKRAPLEAAVAVATPLVMGGFVDSHFHAAQIFLNSLKTLFPEKYEFIYDNLISFEMKAGEALIFSSGNIHGSNPNNGKHERLAVGGRHAGDCMDIYAGRDSDDPFTDSNHFRPHTAVLKKQYLTPELVHS